MALIVWMEDSPLENYGVRRRKCFPSALKDPDSGNLLTTEKSKQDAAVRVYTKRLANRPIKDDLKHIKDTKDILCEKLIKLAKSNKTPRISIFRSILDRLIYNDEISNIDSNLTDCNVGARKNRNIKYNWLKRKKFKLG